MARMTAPPELEYPENRERWGLGKTKNARGPYMVELNVQYVDGLSGAAAAFEGLFKDTVGKPTADAPWQVDRVSKSYYRCYMNLKEWKNLIAQDEDRAKTRAKKERQARDKKREEKRKEEQRQAKVQQTETSTEQALPAEGSSEIVDSFRYKIIYKLWPDFPVRARIIRSIATIKADAALRTFEASGEAITWAVIDSGVDASHPHFGDGFDHVLKDPSVENLHRCFVEVGAGPLKDPDQMIDGKPIKEAERKKRVDEHRDHALIDPFGHGTHVTGIMAGRVPKDAPTFMLEQEQLIEPGYEQENVPERRTITKQRPADARQKERFHGIAPLCRIVSLRVLDEEGGGRSSNIVRALEYIREKVNDNPKLLRIHGVNLSVGYEFDAEMFACGQSPLCTEVNRLVQSGVVVVTAAGNTGYSTLTANNRVTKVGLSNTINDPGNAELAITVGSTHRESPHTFGISFFSSKGPTGDGRLKPDLVAPGERIVSCAAGEKKRKALEQLESAEETTEASKAPAKTAAPASSAKPGSTAQPEPAFYIEDSGTSMAAPHVSGAIAAFLSIRREFIGKPLDVKRIFLDSAIPLGRERYFEGRGLLDLMRAIQSV